MCGIFSKRTAVKKRDTRSNPYAALDGSEKEEEDFVVVLIIPYHAYPFSTQFVDVWGVYVCAFVMSGCLMVSGRVGNASKEEEEQEEHALQQCTARFGKMWM